MKRRYIWIFIGVVLAVSVSATVVWWNLRQLCRYTPPEEEFTESRWASGPRGGLAPSLVRSKRLDGQTKQAVLKMLGPAGAESPNSLRYPVGGVPCSMTSASLDIEFDQSGRVAEYTLRPD